VVVAEVTARLVQVVRAALCRPADYAALA